MSFSATDSPLILRPICDALPERSGSALILFATASTYLVEDRSAIPEHADEADGATQQVVTSEAER
ncbi:MAG: hypothetical protein QOH60_1606, partial [Mycobacterium sp.]|nr:hypothetical protein [Mycobacterium sp.]